MQNFVCFASYFSWERPQRWKGNPVLSLIINWAMSAKSASKTALYHFNPSCSVLETNSKCGGRCLYDPGFWKGAGQLQVSWDGLVSASRAGAQQSSWGPAQPQLGEMSGECAGRGNTSLVQPPFCSAFQQRKINRSFFRTELRAYGGINQGWPRELAIMEVLIWVAAHFRDFSWLQQYLVTNFRKR